MQNIIERKEYLDRLKEVREKNVIKIITGIRRSGKSVLLSQFQGCLKQDGVTESQIVSLNFEELENEELTDYKKLNEYLVSKIIKGKYTYIFLDEVQMVKDFQKVVDSIYAKNGKDNILVDLYITGSNSYLLSNKISTLLSGRFVEISMLPLSFKEYIQVRKNAAFEKGETSTTMLPKKFMFTNSFAQAYKRELIDYIKFGGFPQTLEMDNETSINSYLDGILNTVIVKDIMNREENVDPEILKMLLKFIMHNVGSIISSNKIANTFTTNGRKIVYNTVEKYLGYLKDSFIIYEIGRFDVKGKEHLKQSAKYYIVDTGLRNMLLANREPDIGHILENIVYLELLRRNPKSITVSKDDKISVGKLDTKEIDFVVQNKNETVYYQVAASLLDKNALERELAPLNAIKDHYQKFIITLDDYTAGSVHNGIKIINIIDFLLE